MFTGIVEGIGRVVDPAPRLRISCPGMLAGTMAGDSIAVNGVCLTALEPGQDSFQADVSPETLDRTNLGDLTRSSIVNLERPVQANDRLSGHIVQGHVDATGLVVSLTPLPDLNWWWRVRVPERLMRYLIHKGSIAMDGMSLTIAHLEDDIVSIAIIPHTYDVTNLRTRRAGDRVNIEVDLIAKYVEKLVRREESADLR